MFEQPKTYQQALSQAHELYNLDEVNHAIHALCKSIKAHYAKAQCHFEPPLQAPLVTLTVMNGGMMFSSLALMQLDMTLECDYIHATRYAHNQTGGDLALLAEPKMDLHGRCVLLLDDIFDDGITLARVKQYCLDRGAIDVQTAVLIYKDKHRTEQPIAQPDFEALRVPDKFIFGMGMDASGLYRNAPGIYYFDETA